MHGVVARRGRGRAIHQVSNIRLVGGHRQRRTRRVDVRRHALGVVDVISSLVQRSTIRQVAHRIHILAHRQRVFGSGRLRLHALRVVDIVSRLAQRRTIRQIAHIVAELVLRPDDRGEVEAVVVHRRPGRRTALASLNADGSRSNHGKSLAASKPSGRHGVLFHGALSTCPGRPSGSLQRLQLGRGHESWRAPTQEHHAQTEEGHPEDLGAGESLGHCEENQPIKADA
mmetsp:Transcript_43393/g.103415  ORF Transcript_43393/g.103415 Transcript_43393/m.103415 type:complete len:228 (+) Transcript_43393:117-800(+)